MCPPKKFRSRSAPSSAITRNTPASPASVLARCRRASSRRKFANEIRKDVIDGLLPERFNQGVRDLGVKPVGQPQVTELNVEDGQPLHVKAVFEYIPEFSIDGYQSVTVEKPSEEVTEEEFQHELTELRDSRATIEPVEEDRALVDGDWAQISYTGTIDGEPDAEPIAGQDALVEIGGKDTIDAFNTVLRDAKVGQELKAEVIYPAEYPESKLAGKTVSYEVSVKAIKKRIVPELTDEFAKELGSYENVAELETRVREHMASRKKRSVAGETKDRLMAALIEKYPFPVPESLVQDQVDARLERGLRALAAQGMETEQMRKLDFSRLRTAQRDGAIAEVKTFLLLDKIAEAEGITVDDEELDRELNIAALQSREPIETLRQRLTDDGGLARIREQMKREKNGEFAVREAARIARQAADTPRAPEARTTGTARFLQREGDKAPNGRARLNGIGSHGGLSRRAGASAPTTSIPVCSATTSFSSARRSTIR